MTLTHKAKLRMLSKLRVMQNNRAEKLLRRNAVLWKELESYRQKTSSTGCNFLDFWELYKYIRIKKPSQILECGTGVSTIVMAQALLENTAEGKGGSIISMEESPHYFELALSLLPHRLKRYLTIVQSPVIEDSYLFFRGMRYRDIPDFAYDFVFIDGPNYISPHQGMVTCDFDLIYIIRKSKMPLDAIIDKRVSTCYVLQKLLPRKNFYYDSVKHLGYCKACSSSDLRNIQKDEPSRDFAKSFRVFGRTILDINNLSDSSRRVKKEAL